MIGTRTAIRLGVLGGLAVAWGTARAEDPVRRLSVKALEEVAQPPRAGQTEVLLNLIRQGDPKQKELIQSVDLLLSGVANENEAGATLEPADASLRAQLGLPEGQGLVVT